jgi:hypothetical protein
MIAVRYLVRSLLLCSCVLTCLSGCQAWTAARTSCRSTTSSSRIVLREHLSISHRGPILANRCQSPTLATGARIHHQQQRYQISPSTAARSRVSLSLGIIDVEENASALVPVVLIVAVTLFVAAQGWINSLLSGDRGLGAFLSDGSGFQKSGFRPVSSGDGKEAESEADPLPWLKLPKLDFVEVAGQDSSVSEEAVMERLEELRMEMSSLLEQKKFKEASAVRLTLEKLMKVNGVEYQYSSGPVSGDKDAFQ